MSLNALSMRGRRLLPVVLLLSLLPMCTHTHTHCHGNAVVPRAWGAWGAWSTCNCGTTQRMRMRPCTGCQGSCDNPYAEIDVCSCTATTTTTVLPTTTPVATTGSCARVVCVCVGRGVFFWGVCVHACGGGAHSSCVYHHTLALFTCSPVVALAAAHPVVLEMVASDNTTDTAAFLAQNLPALVDGLSTALNTSILGLEVRVDVSVWGVCVRVKRYVCMDVFVGCVCAEPPCVCGTQAMNPTCCCRS